MNNLTERGLSLRLSNEAVYLEMILYFNTFQNKTFSGFLLLELDIVCFSMYKDLI